MSPRPLRFTLTDKQVVEIRTRYAADRMLTHIAIAEAYGIGCGSVRRIIIGKYRPDLGGPFTSGRFHRVPIIPGDSDILYSLRATASFLGIKRGTVREYLSRGNLIQEAAGLVTYDSIIKHQSRQYVPPALYPDQVTFTCCKRCGEVEFDEGGLCDWCREEAKNGKYSWWCDKEGM